MADAAGISAETIKNIEHGTFHASTDTTEKILKAFHDKGVEFIGIQKSLKDGVSIGVTLTSETKSAAQENGNVVKLKSIRQS